MTRFSTVLINFISYLDPFVHSGGGEQITRKLIESGRARGHTITQTHMNPPSGKFLNEDSVQLNILWDVFNCPEERNPFNPEIIKWVTECRVPYVYGTGGYEDLCALGALPCHGVTNGIDCFVPEDHNTFGVGGIGRPHPGQCTVKTREYLLKNANLCVFFSELHKEMTEKMVGKVPSLVAIPPVTGLEAYHNTGTERDIPLLSYGGHLEYKGFFNIMEAYPDECPVFIGGGEPHLPYTHKYGKFAGKVPQENMPWLLNRVQKFVHMPRWPEPYGLTTLQAMLCGCEVIQNENSVVNDNLEEIARWSECAPIWKAIEEVIK